MGTSGKMLPRFKEFSHPLLDKPYIFLPGITQEAFDESLSYKAMPDDVFLVTYPKCGTTWIMNVLHLMRKAGQPVEEGKYLCDEIPFLEVEPLANLEKPHENLKIIKTHLYFDLTPWNPETKYIFVARNPKDCFVSFFYHTVGFELYEFSDGKFEDYFELVINGEVDSGDYFKCVGEWYEKSKTESNILFLLYEDIKVHPRREFLKIADFIGPEWGRRVRAENDDLLEKMVEHSSFQKMREMKNIFQDNDFAWKKDMPFLRKGVIGDWKTFFTEEQSKRVDERMKKAAIKYPGFDQLWDKYVEQLTF